MCSGFGIHSHCPAFVKFAEIFDCFCNLLEGFRPQKCFQNIFDLGLILKDVHHTRSWPDANIMLMLVLLKCTRDFAIFRAKHNMLHSLLVYRNDGVVQVLLWGTLVMRMMHWCVWSGYKLLCDFPRCHALQSFQAVASVHCAVQPWWCTLERGHNSAQAGMYKLWCEKLNVDEKYKHPTSTIE